MATEGQITLGIGSNPAGLRWLFTFGLNSAVQFIPHGVVGADIVILLPTVRVIRHELHVH